MIRCNNKLIIGAYSKKNNLIIFDLKTERIEHEFSFGIDIKDFEGIHGIDTIDNNNLFINTNKGLFIYNIENNITKPYYQLTSKIIIMPKNRNKDKLHFLDYDKGQLYSFNRQNHYLEKLNSTWNEFFEKNTIMMYDNSGNLYISGYGIFKLSANNNFSIIKPKLSNDIQNRYYSMSISKNSLWMGNATYELEKLSLKGETTARLNYNNIFRYQIVNINYYKNKFN